MLTTLRSIIAVALVALPACDKAPAPADKQATRAEGSGHANDAGKARSTGVPKAADGTKPAGGTAATKRKEITRAQRAEARRLIRKGRALSKAKKIDEALLAFEAASKSDPVNSTAACEAGFAAFRLDKLEPARKYLKHGLTVVQQPKKEAACLYNLGLVEEKLGDSAQAVEHYKRSLSLRDNAVVHAKLAKLAPDGHCVPPERVLDFTKVSCGLPSDYDSCGMSGDGEPVDEEVEGHAELPTLSGDVAEVAPGLRLEVRATQWGAGTRMDLILDRSGKKSLIGYLGTTVQYSTPSAKVRSVRLAQIDLVAGGLPEVVVTVQRVDEEDLADLRLMECEAKHDEGSTALADCEDKALESEETKSTTVTSYLGCGEVDGHWACGASPKAPKTHDEFMALFRCAPADAGASTGCENLPGAVSKATGKRMLSVSTLEREVRGAKRDESPDAPAYPSPPFTHATAFGDFPVPVACGETVTALPENDWPTLTLAVVESTEEDGIDHSYFRTVLEPITEKIYLEGKSDSRDEMARAWHTIMVAALFPADPRAKVLPPRLPKKLKGKGKAMFVVDADGDGEPDFVEVSSDGPFGGCRTLYERTGSAWAIVNEACAD